MEFNKYFSVLDALSIFKVHLFSSLWLCLPPIFYLFFWRKLYLKRFWISAITFYLILFIIYLSSYGHILIPSPAKPPLLDNQFKVMTYNILNNGIRGPEAVLNTIEEVSPDILALQEIRVRGKNKNLIFNRLQGDAGYKCKGVPYFKDKSQGLALCVRKPFRIITVRQRLYTSRVPQKWHYLFCEVKRENKIFNLVVVHLYPFQINLYKRTLWDQIKVIELHHKQASALQNTIYKFKDPTIMLGDFNSTPDTSIHSMIRKKFNDSFYLKGSGFGASFWLMGIIPLRIDYIYLTKEFKISQSYVVTSNASDHRPMVSDLWLSP